MGLGQGLGQGLRAIVRVVRSRLGPSVRLHFGHLVYHFALTSLALSTELATVAFFFEGGVIRCISIEWAPMLHIRRCVCEYMP